MKNETLTAEIESFGAELKSIKSNATGVEYMWYGKPEYYKRTSPILFPFVGNLKNQEYTYEGKKYPMTQHGFARDMEFKVTEQKEDVLEETEQLLTEMETGKQTEFTEEIQQDESDREKMTEETENAEENEENTEKRIY